MNPIYGELTTEERVVANFLLEYYRIWQRHFPGLNKRAHWHVIFAARRDLDAGVPCRSLHRTLYGAYGTDIRTCIERVRDCAADGYVTAVDMAEQPSTPSANCIIRATDKLRENFDGHCRETVAEVCSVFGEEVGDEPVCDDATIAEIFDFCGGYDQKWRENCSTIVASKKLTPAYLNDAMDHLVTFQYLAIVMLLWWKSPFGADDAESPAMVIDEINSKMWDMLRLGHLAIKERVNNLIRWGFFDELTIKKHKAVALTPLAGETISRGLADMKPLVRQLHGRLVPARADAPVRVAV
jgi:hypothetical protein